MKTVKVLCVITISCTIMSSFALPLSLSSFLVFGHWTDECEYEEVSYNNHSTKVLGLQFPTLHRHIDHRLQLIGPMQDLLLACYYL